MNLELSKMKSIAAQCYTSAAISEFGASGQDTLLTLIDLITRIYRNIEPAERRNKLSIFLRIPEVELPSEAESVMPRAEISSPERITHELDDDCIVEATSGGKLKVFSSTQINVASLSSVAVVYQWIDRQEQFRIGNRIFVVNNPSPTHASIFARPTFSSLTEALEDYRNRIVQYTSCFLLEQAWSDKARLFLKAKPESTMRRSLHQYLRTVFRDAEVRPEQIVDESHPVDIKITWSDSNKRAMIEIKWLGESKDPHTGEVTTRYTASRALAGAKQLAEYLDSDNTAGPGLRTRG